MKTPIKKWVLNSKQYLNILLVDDDAVCVEAIASHLQSIGINQSTANNGQNAIEIIKKMAQSNKYFNIIVMDCEMPIMDGYEASTRIKDMCNKEMIPDLKIIALTGNIHDQAKCTENLMDQVLCKPASKLALIQKINEALHFEAIKQADD